ncbi:unnamed protein product, partial [Vitis vinifera]|uniref:Uncharacterized protein n=1 Tax=Vitis vinifera TaxID=29760 RepID=D7SGW7_VITVI
MFFVKDKINFYFLSIDIPHCDGVPLKTSLIKVLLFWQPFWRLWNAAGSDGWGVIAHVYWRLILSNQLMISRGLSIQ